MNCGNNKNSSRNIILIGIIILFIGGYLYTKQPEWLVGSVPLLLLLCCPLMMLMMGCMNKKDENQDTDKCHNKDNNFKLKEASKDNAEKPKK